MRSSPQPSVDASPDFRAAPGLYLHVPFCASICPFCPYNKVILRESLAKRYFSALESEIEHYLTAFAGQFESLYVGGGTPTLCLDSLARLLPRLRVRGERAIEVLPRHADPVTLARLRDLGFGYVSLGVQSFDDGVLRHLARPYTAAESRAALENALGRFDCVDVDLIFDVAHESEGSFLADLEHCFRAGADQVSAYPLMRFGFTPFGKAQHDRRTEHRLLRIGEQLAAKHGYERRSVWTFNRPGAPAYTSITREFYLGLGAGAASYTGSEFFVNHFSIERYAHDLDRGRLPLARRARLGELRGALYYGFWQAYRGSIDLRRFESLFPVARWLTPLVRILAGIGLVELTGGRARLTTRGYDVYHDLERWVTYQLIEPLWGDLTRERTPERTQRRRQVANGIWRRLSGVELAGAH